MQPFFKLLLGIKLGRLKGLLFPLPMHPTSATNSIIDHAIDIDFIMLPRPSFNSTTEIFISSQLTAPLVLLSLQIQT